ncbi:type I restriction enzyme, S subunit [Gammaproteobacteria bacterium]
MTTAIDITTEQRKILLAFLRQFIPGVVVWAYGSRVKWTARINSDLDLVVFATPAQRSLVSELKDALAESNLPFLVDLHIWDDVPERFHEIIRKEYVVLQEVEEKSGGWVMAGDLWIKTTIGEQATLQRGIDITKAEQRDGKVPVVSSGGISSYHDTAAVNGPGVILGRKGVVGSVFFVNEDYWPHDTSLWVKDFHRNYPRFVYYFFKSVAPQIAKMDVGSANPTLNRNHVHPLPIIWPPLPTQKAIAHILGTLDDKIELNRRMNATLEAMARAIFKSWFVDFDPVRAKMDGRVPFGMDEETATLFPDGFQDSELGLIPRGWGVKMIRDIGNIICGKTPPTKISKYYGDDIQFITIPDMHGNIFVIETARKLSYAGANLQDNKTIPPESICVSCIATPGLVIITSENSQTNQQINSIVPYAKDETYFWYWVMTGLGTEIAANGSGGSVLINLSKGRFETLQVIQPPHSLICAYHTAVRPLFETILANTHQSRTLATLRDTLLPKLLSGELSVAAMESKIDIAN